MNLYVPDLDSPTQLAVPFPGNDESINNGLPSTETTWRLTTGEIWQLFFAGTPGLGYLRKALSSMRVVTYPYATATTAEKRRALGLLDERGYLVVKAMLLRDKKGQSGITIVVAPDYGRVNLRAIPRGRHLRFIPRDELPWGMEHGICTPFIPEGAQTQVLRIVFDRVTVGQRLGQFYDFSIALADVPVGNHQLSMQMPYATSYDLLRQQFPGVVEVYDLF